MSVLSQLAWGCGGIAVGLVFGVAALWLFLRWVTRTDPGEWHSTRTW